MLFDNVDDVEKVRQRTGTLMHRHSIGGIEIDLTLSEVQDVPQKLLPIGSKSLS